MFLRLTIQQYGFTDRTFFAGFAPNGREFATGAHNGDAVKVHSFPSGRVVGSAEREALFAEDDLAGERPDDVGYLAIFLDGNHLLATTGFGRMILLDRRSMCLLGAVWPAGYRLQVHLVISALVEEELASAPPQVRDLYDEMLALAEVVGITEEATQLRQAYLDAGILTPRAFADALHVALASAAGCAIIVSWNFRHIVNFRRIPLYNAVNAVQGYGRVAIHSPLEVIAVEDEDV